MYFDVLYMYYCIDFDVFCILLHIPSMGIHAKFISSQVHFFFTFHYCMLSGRSPADMLFPARLWVKRTNPIFTHCLIHFTKSVVMRLKTSEHNPSEPTPALYLLLLTLLDMK